MIPIDVNQLKIRGKIPGFGRIGFILALPGFLFFDVMDGVGQGGTPLRE
jgi:hypothetical protein